MSASVMPASSPSNVPWWKEPTKDQWYAYIAAWLGWTLDAFDFTIFLLIMVPIAQEFDVPHHRGHRRLHLDLVAAPGRRHRRRLDGRSHGAQDAADDLHPVVLALQLHRRLLADLLLPVLLPRAARHRHGRRMAGRRGACDGILAGALARLHERHPAGLVGPGLRAVGAGLRLALRATSAGAACCGSASCRRWWSCGSASSSRSRKCGPRTSGCRPRGRPRSTRRCSPSSSASISSTR